MPAPVIVGGSVTPEQFEELSQSTGLNEDNRVIGNSEGSISGKLRGINAAAQSSEELLFQILEELKRRP